MRLTSRGFPHFGVLALLACLAAVTASVAGRPVLDVVLIILAVGYVGLAVLELRDRIVILRGPMPPVELSAYGEELEGQGGVLLARRPPAVAAGLVPLPGVPPLSRDFLTQDEYAELLAVDAARACDYDDAGHCRRCGKAALPLIVSHPIWDGPFDGVGSGAVDTRRTLLCPWCDPKDPHVYGLPRVTFLGELIAGLAQLRPLRPFLADPARLPAVPGRPLLLPWLGDERRLQLRPELIARPAFHNLGVAVEPWRAPGPAAADAGITQQDPRLRHPYQATTNPHPLFAGRCAVCGRPWDDQLIHPPEEIRRGG